MVVNASPNVARVQCEFESASLDPATPHPHPGGIRVGEVFGARFKSAGKNSLAERARKRFPASIQIRRQDQERWTVAGSGEFAFLRFSVDTSAEQSATEFAGTFCVQEHAPFLSKYRGGTVELLALAPHPSTNGPAWLPNGTPATEPFPFSNGKNSAAGKVMNEIAFRIHSDSGTASFPVTKYEPNLVGGMGGAFFTAEPKSPDRFFVQAIACAPDTKQVNVQLGVADGDWELVKALKVNSQLSGSSQMSGENGEWAVQYQGVEGTSGDVALAFSYSKRDEWETRMVALKSNGTLTPLLGSRTDAGRMHGVVSLATNEFSQIAEFQLQRRKYQWVEFRNVSLESGQRTTVEVSDATGVNRHNPANKTFREVFGKPAGPRDVPLVDLTLVGLNNQPPHISPGPTTAWKANGTRLEKDTDWMFAPGKIWLQSGGPAEKQLTGIAVRVANSDSTEPARIADMDFDGKQDAIGSFAIVPNQKNEDNWVGLIRAFPPEQKTATVRVAVSHGPFISGPEPGKRWSSNGGTPFGSFTTGEVFERKGTAAVHFAHDLRNCDVRLLAFPYQSKQSAAERLWNKWKREVTRSGRQQQNWVAGRRVESKKSGSQSLEVWEFPGLSVRDGASIQIEVRPIHWVMFENVALQPGEETPVKISVEPVPH
jgi:hypothetical protein